MMKNKILLIAVAVFSILGYSCDSFLDVNHDPNVLEEIPDAKVVLPTAQANLGNQLMGWELGFAGGFWSEYWTQKHDHSQFKTLCDYDEQEFATAYSDLTAGVLIDLNKMKEVSEENTDRGVYYVAEALSIFTWQVLTDIWGSVPYFEAVQGDKGIDAPKFDSGEEIYSDLLKRVDELIAIDLSRSTLDGTYDLYYGGDLERWKDFANSLKLKLMMRLSETPQYDNTEVVNFIESVLNDRDRSFITKSAMISGETWSDNQEGKRHPMREFEAGNAEYLSGNVIACKSFSRYLIRNNDPRMDVLFEPRGDVQKGAFFGDYESKEDTDGNGTDDEDEKYSMPVFKGDMDLIVMSDWEIYFFIAEAYAREGDSSNAKMYYEMGVIASLEQNGISDDDILMSGGYAEWTAGTTEEQIKTIMMQKWVANCNYQHIESFLERNRTKYPAVNTVDVELDRQTADEDFQGGFLTISVKGRAKLSGQLPSSPIYPTSVISRNPNAPDQRVNLLTKVWWNQKPGL